MPGLGGNSGDGLLVGPVSLHKTVAGSKAAEVVRGFGLYPSDQAVLRRGVGVAALKKAPVIGYYMGRIHTRHDTVLEEENVQLLCRGAVRLAGTLKEQKDGLHHAG